MEDVEIINLLWQREEMGLLELENIAPTVTPLQ